MPHIKVYIHFVFTTKNRTPYLHSPEIRAAMWGHIMDTASKKNIYLDQINGYSEHCHCLISMSASQTIEEVMRLIKGESAYWINRSGLLKEKFEWQSQYFAVSVSESILERVRNYIKNQENHHRKKTFAEEYEEFINRYGFVIK